MSDLEWLFHVELGFLPTLIDSLGSTFKNNCVKSNNHRPIISAGKMWINDSTFWQYELIGDI